MVGGIAGAILSIAGVIALLTPNEPPSGRGEFESVTADPAQGLTEFAAHLQTASRDGGGRGVQPAFQAVSLRVATVAERAQAPPDTSAPGSAGSEQAPGATTPASPSIEPTPTEPTPTEPVPTEPIPTEPIPSQPEGGGGSVLGRVQSQLPVEALPPDWEYARIDGEPGLVVRKEDCDASFSSLQGECHPLGDGDRGRAVVAAEQLLRVFSATRSQPLAGSAATEPVGAAVNFNLTLENLKGRTVIVRWSMYRIGAGSPLSHDWLVNRRVYNERVDRSSQTVSRQFWVPLPRQRGPYFVRLSAWDQDNRLDYEDSKPPFQ